MNSGIYSLVARNIDTNEFVDLPIEDMKTKEIRRKTNVSSIDKLTTFFSSEQELINRLYDKGYINFKNADIFIKYKYDNIDKFLQPIYKNFEYFRGLTEQSESKINIKNDYFIYYQDTVFAELNKKEVLNYILNESNMNSKIKEHIFKAYKQSKSLDEVNYFKKKIVEDLSSYRVLRDMITNFDEYYNPKNKMERMLKTEDRRRALKRIETEEFLAKTINITIPNEYKKDEKENQLFEDGMSFKGEGQEIMEMMDLDDIIYGLSEDEALALGIDKRKMDEYVVKARK